jgi:integrase
MKTFRSIFAQPLSAYIKLLDSLGYRLEEQTCILTAFDQWIFEKKHLGALTQELALEFACSNPKNCMNYCARHYQVVRHFSEYLATFDPQTPRLDPKALQRSEARNPRRIYTEQELEKILSEARHISPKNRVAGLTLYTMIGLAACTGLRISEIVRLDREDVDLKTGLLNIRHSKFGKSRLVPIHKTTLEIVRNYAAVRDAAYPSCKDIAFFITSRRKRFARNTLQQLFAGAAFRAGLCEPKGRGPSFHDLRHRFATERLLRWYKAGIDVQAMLPALATYMGHTHYSDTAYYLTATAELLGLAADRYQQWLTGKEAESRCIGASAAHLISFAVHLKFKPYPGEPFPCFGAGGNATLYRSAVQLCQQGLFHLKSNWALL